MPCRPLICLPLILLLTLPHAARAAGFDAPDGFEVALYADDDLAHNIFAMTFDSHGRVVVAGPDYIKTLHDTNGDGAADKATLFSDKPASGAHGLYFDGPNLLATGDNSLLHLRDTNGDGRADLIQSWATLAHPEHGANGIVKGPDGWIYVICGNDANVTPDHATTNRSPVTNPDTGALLRFAPDGSAGEIVADGFRNPYDLAFNRYGHVFTVDADGERDHHLPWYAGTRLFDIQQGWHHGWVLEGWRRAWNRPDYFFDNTQWLVEIGRGSPTGVETYHHHQFPQRYRHGVFAVCWTFGVVYFLPITPDGDTYTGDVETFLRPTGNAGFAPVAAEVGPEGDLFIAIGGRGTRGGVFRVRYTGDPDAPRPGAPEPDADPLDRTLRAPQPLSSWSRAQWVPLAKNLGRQPFERAAADTRRTTGERIRAIEILVELFHGIGPDAARSALLDTHDEPQLRARIAWSLGREELDLEGLRDLATLTWDDHPLVQRTAWEALATQPNIPAGDGRDLDAAWLPAAQSPHRRVRAAMIAAARGPARHAFNHHADQLAQSTRGRLALCWVRGPDANDNPDWPNQYVRWALDALTDPPDDDPDPANANADLRLDALRLLQLALGDILIEGGELEIDTGYTANHPGRIPAQLRDEITAAAARALDADPAPDAAPLSGAGLRAPLERALAFESARLFAMLAPEAPHLPDQLTRLLRPDTHPADDIHHLLALSRIPADRPHHVTKATARALNRLHPKSDHHDLLLSRNWPLRVGELFDRLTQRDPRLPEALVEDPAFGHARHTLFAERLTGQLRQRATRRLLHAAEAARAAGDPDPWSPDLVALVAELDDDEALDTLRDLWPDHHALRDPIARALAQNPDPRDRPLLIEALASINPQTVARAAHALREITPEQWHGRPARDSDPAPDPAALAAAADALRRHAASSEASDALHPLLTHWTGQKFPDYQAWHDHLAATHPDAAPGAPGLTAGDPSTNAPDTDAWRQRLANLDFSKGDPARGRIVFDQRACAACHTGSRPLGPSLASITDRLTPADIFLQTVDPNRSISPLYEALEIVTTSGETYTGVPVYQSPDSTILEIAPGATVRITGDQTHSTRPATRSPMPQGLLDNATNQDLADLYQYLKGL